MLRITEKISWILLCLFFIAVPLSFISTKALFYPYLHTISLFDPFKELVARIITFVLFVILLIQVAFYKKPLIKTSLYIPLCLILILQFLSLLWAHNPYQGFEYFLHWLTLFTFFFVCLNTLKSTDSIKSIMKISLIPAFLICWISIICYTLGVDLPFFQNRIFGWSATFGNYKFAAEYVTPLIFWSLGLFYSEKIQWKKKYYLGITFFFILTLIFIYKSRASLMGLFAVLPVALFFPFFQSKLIFYKRHRKLLLSVSCLIVLFFTLCFFSVSKNRGLLSPIQNTFQLQKGSSSQRVIMWKNTLHMATDHFWRGVGVGNFNLMFPSYTSAQDRYHLPLDTYWNHFVRQAHNEYLQLFSELGIFGILLCIVTLFLICKTIFKNFEYIKRTSEEKLAILLFASFLCSVVIALFVFNFQNTTSSFLWVATMALLIKISPPPGKVFTSHHWLFKILIILFIGALLCVFPKPLARGFMSTYLQFQGKSFSDMHDLRAFQKFETSLTWDPHNWETHFLMGKAYGDHLLYPQAITHLKKSLELNPFEVAVLYNLGFFLEKNKNWDEAIQVYNRLLTLAPDFRKANVRLGYVVFSLNRTEEAKTYFKKALLPAAYQESEISEAYRALAFCHLRQGNTKKATKDILEAFLLNPKVIEQPLFKFWLEKN